MQTMIFQKHLLLIILLQNSFAFVLNHVHDGIETDSLHDFELLNPNDKLHKEHKPHLTDHDHGYNEFEVEFHSKGELGLEFDKSKCVVRFTTLPPHNKLGPAELSGLIEIGDCLVAVNEEDVFNLEFNDFTQVLLDSAKSKNRLFRFRAVNPKRRELSIAAKRIQGVVKGEHLDVYSSAGHVAAVEVVSAKNFGGSAKCNKFGLVAASSIYGCSPIEDEDQIKKLKDRYVLVKRGTCSFLHKASMVEAAGAKGVLIINDSGALFQMETDEMENMQVAIPVVLLSNYDGESLLKACKSDKLESLSARLVTTEECHREEENSDYVEYLESDEGAHLLENDIPDDPTKSVVENNLHKVEILKQRQYGKHALGGELHLHRHDKEEAIDSRSEAEHVESFEFLTATFSGPLVVDKAVPFYLYNHQVHQRSKNNLCKQLRNKSEDDRQYNKYNQQAVVVHNFLLHPARHLENQQSATLDRYTVSECGIEDVVKLLQEQHAGMVIFTAYDSVLRHLGSAHIVLPSVVAIPVLTVSSRAGNMLAKRLDTRLVVKPDNSFSHRWDELRAVLSHLDWPADAKARKRLLSRLKKVHNPADKARRFNDDPAILLDAASDQTRGFTDCASQVLQEAYNNAEKKYRSEL